MKKINKDHLRHVIKTVTWRMVGTADTVVLGWLISGDASIGLKIGGLEFFTKMLLYYLHERFWYKYVSLGRKIKE